MFLKKYIVALFLVALLASCTKLDISGNNIKKIRIVSIPTEDQKEQLLHLQPLAEYLTKETGLPVEFIITSDYTASVEALRSGHAEMAWLGPFSYVLASNLVNVQPVVGGIRKDTGDVYYNSIILVQNSANIYSLSDLRGNKFAFIDPASTSGYLFPLSALRKNGINPEKDFSKVIYAGSHTAVELALANGQVDAIADSLPSYELMVKNNNINPSNIRIIWKSEKIPPSPLVARVDLGPEKIQAIQKALVKAGPEVISFEGEISGYAIVKDSDYDVVRDVAKELGLYEKSK